MHAGDIAGARSQLTDIESAAGADSGAWRRLAEFHTHLNQHEQAATCAIRVATLKPYDAQAAYAKASALIAVGRMAEAEEILDELIGRTPEDADAWYNRATLRRQVPGHNHVAPLRAALAARSPGTAPVALYYALAKELEDLGQYAESFAALAQGAARAAGCFPTASRPTSRRSPRSSAPSTAPGTSRGPGLRGRRADLRRRPAAERHDAGRADPDPPRAGRDGRRGQRSRARGHANGRPFRRQGRADQGGGQRRSRGARRVLLDRDPGLRPFAAVRGRQDAAQLSLPRPDREGAAARAHRARAPPPDGVLLRDVQDAVPHGLPVLLRPRRPRPLLRRLRAAHELLARAAAGPLPRPRLRGAGRRPGRHDAPAARALRPRVASACLRFHENPAPTATASAAQVRRPIYRESVDLWRNYRQELAPLARHLSHNGIAVE